MENWYKLKVMLQGKRTIIRKPPANLELLPARLRKIFSKIQVQDCPEIWMNQGSNVLIDINGAIYDQHGKIHLSHHEFSELRVVRHRLNMRPTINDFIDSPKKSFRKYWRYLNPKRIKKNIEYLCPKSNYLYFCDDRAQSNFYHWFADAIVRLLISFPYTQESKLLLSKKQLDCKYMLESLKLLGIDDSRFIPIQDDRIYHADNLQVISTAIYSTGACSPDGVELLRKKITIESPSPTERIYLARKSSLGRGIENHLEFQGTLERYGVRPIYPEDHSIEELIDVLGNTKLLIGVYGAALTHVVFMPKNSHLIELAANHIGEKPSYWRGEYVAKYAGDCYYSIANASEVNYSLVPCKQVDKTVGLLNSKILVDLEILSKTIEMAVK